MDHKQSKDTEVKTRVVFDYEKSSNFRVAHIDGIHGGLSPDGGNIVMSMFSERRPIPQRETYDVKDGNLVRDDSATVMRECDIFREIEFCAVIDFATAKALHEWLGVKMAEFENFQQAIRSARAERKASRGQE